MLTPRPSAGFLTSVRWVTKLKYRRTEGPSYGERRSGAASVTFVSNGASHRQDDRSMRSERPVAATFGPQPWDGARPRAAPLGRRTHPAPARPSQRELRPERLGRA